MLTKIEGFTKITLKVLEIESFESNPRFLNHQ